MAISRKGFFGLLLGIGAVCGCASRGERVVPARESKPRGTSWFARTDVSEQLSCFQQNNVDPILAANLWRVVGPDRDLVVDTGLGVVPLREHLPELFTRDPVAFVSHWHLDHSGGAHEFPDVRVFASGVPELRQPPKSSLRSDELADDLGIQKSAASDYSLLFELPEPGYDVAGYRVQPAPGARGMSDGERIDLGGKTQLVVTHLPGHTHDSAGLFNERTGELFTGDVAHGGRLIDDSRDSSVEDYRASFQKLRDMDVRAVYPGHGAVFGAERLRQVAEDYLRRGS